MSKDAIRAVGSKVEQLVVVAVTYGSRWSLLRQALAAARIEGASSAIIVDNGSHVDIGALADAEFGEWADTIRLETNQGSACGFATGIARALDCGHDLLLLLDDDNRLMPGAVQTLRRSLATVRRTNPMAAVFALREGHGGGLVDRIRRGVALRHRNAAFGFHLADLPGKIARRLLPGRSRETPFADAPEMIVARAAPYGGLLLPRALIDTIGLPDERYVLYQDDHEFTQRIVAAGGVLMLITDATIQDLEGSHNAELATASSFSRLLNAQSDFRVFYTFRNMAHLDRYRRGPVGPIFRVNLAVHSAVLLIAAIVYRRVPRFRLLRRALADATMERLGVDPAFPLP